MGTQMRVVVTDEIGDSYDIERQVLQQLDVEFIVCKCHSVEDVVHAAIEADGVLCNLAPMPSEAISKLRRCKVISRYGVGFDNVDVLKCTEKGIWVANVPDYCVHEVAEHAIALLFACTRSIALKNQQIRLGKWDQQRNDFVQRIYGKTIAFLGFGNIPRAMSQKMSMMGLNMLAYDPYVKEEEIAAFGVRKVEWKTALSEADIFSVHLPYSKETKNIIGEATFAKMKSGAVIVNTSRGGVIDEHDLAVALREGKIASAGLDVFMCEPLPLDSPLRELDNCVLTDHSAWYSREAICELKQKCAENVRAVLAGELPKYPINNPHGNI